MPPIYLDHNATTPVDPDVLQVMLPFLSVEFGNPSSAHALGRRALRAVEDARAQVASLIHASPGEIIFTSGGTEAINIAIRGATARDPKRRSVVTTMIEHPATESCCALLERHGHSISRVRPRPDGRMDAHHVLEAVDDTTALVTIIQAQNEIGTLQPVADIARGARARGSLVHIDAAQSVGKIPVDVDELGVDLLSIAGHKLYAPKGIGALYMRRGVSVSPLLRGAGQEAGHRPGTENVAGIVALGEACRISSVQLEKGASDLVALRDELLARLHAEVPGLLMVGHPTERLPNTLNVLFPGISGRMLLEECSSVMASTGSACHSGNEEPSAILLTLGISRDQALGAVRLSLGRATTRDDVVAAASHLGFAWRKTTRTRVA